MTDDALDQNLTAIHDHLAATAEMPVERSASRWLGEAEALAADLRRSDLSGDVVADRLATIAELLDEVEATGDEAADDRVAAARERVCESRSRLD